MTTQFASHESRKTRRGFGVFRIFKLGKSKHRKKYTKTDTSWQAEVTPGLEAVPFQRPTPSAPPVVERDVTNACRVTCRDNSCVCQTQEQYDGRENNCTHRTEFHSSAQGIKRERATGSGEWLGEVGDNWRNEHIEDVRLQREETGEGDRVMTSYDVTGPRNAGDTSGSERAVAEQPGTYVCAATPRVVPEGLDTPLLSTYLHVLVLGGLFALHVFLGALYALALLVVHPTAASRLVDTVQELWQTVQDKGLTAYIHAGVIVLLCGTGHPYLAVTYALLLLLFLATVAIVTEIVKTFAEVVASLILVLFLAPVVSLFGAFFSLVGARGPAIPRPSINANRLLESLLQIFLFPVSLPAKLQQLRQQRRSPAPPVATDRSKPSRSCDLLSFLFSWRRSRLSKNNSARNSPSTVSATSATRSTKPSYSTHTRGGTSSTGSRGWATLGMGGGAGNGARRGGGGAVFAARGRPSRGCELCRLLRRR